MAEHLPSLDKVLAAIPRSTSNGRAHAVLSMCGVGLCVPHSPHITQPRLPWEVQKCTRKDAVQHTLAGSSVPLTSETHPGLRTVTLKPTASYGQTFVETVDCCLVEQGHRGPETLTICSLRSDILGAQNGSEEVTVGSGLHPRTSSPPATTSSLAVAVEEEGSIAQVLRGLTAMVTSHSADATGM